MSPRLNPGGGVNGILAELKKIRRGGKKMLKHSVTIFTRAMNILPGGVSYEYYPPNGVSEGCGLS